MNPTLIRNSLSSGVYFSFISFIIIWLSGFLYDSLAKTTGKLDMGVVIIIIFTILLIMFLLAITNIVLSDHHARRKEIKFWERIVGVLLFIISSAVIMGVLGFLFWFEV